MSKNSKIAKESVQNIIDGLEKKLKNFKMDLANKSEKLEKKVVDGTWKPAKIAKKKAELKEIEAKINETAEKIAKYEATLKEGTSEEVLDKEKTTYGKFIIEDTKPADDDIEVEAEIVEEANESEGKPEEAKDTKAIVESDLSLAKAKLGIIVSNVRSAYKKIAKVDAFGDPRVGKIITDYFLTFFDVADYAMVVDDKYKKVLIDFSMRDTPRLDPKEFDRQVAFNINIDGVVDSVYEEFIKRFKKHEVASNAFDREFMMQNLLLCEDLSDKQLVAEKVSAFIQEAAIPTHSRIVSEPKFHFELMNGAWINPVTGEALDTDTIKSKGGSDKAVEITESYAQWCKAHGNHKAIRKTA